MSRIAFIQKRVADQEVVIEALRETQAGLAPKSVTYLASALSVFAIAISGFLLYQA